MDSIVVPHFIIHCPDDIIVKFILKKIINKPTKIPGMKSGRSLYVL